MSMLRQFDEAGARHVAETYLTPDIVEQRRAVRAALNLQVGEDVLDIGSGPGYLAYEMAAEVGQSGSVHGVDPSESMLAIAGPAPGQARASDTARVTFTEGDAIALPFEDGSFDAAVATQVYEYVNAVPKALSEARRVLRQHGRLLLLDTDWDSVVWNSSDPERMRRVLTAWNSHLVDPHLPRRLPKYLADAHFTLTYSAVVPLLNVGYHTNTYSAGLVHRVSSYIARQGGVAGDEMRAWSEDLLALNKDHFFSVNRYLFVARN